MESNLSFSEDQARSIGERIGINWSTSRFDVEQFRMGLEIELEHGRRDPATNVSDDELTTGKIARAHSLITTRGWRRWRPRHGATGLSVPKVRMRGIS
jgi:hypothetical protein